MDLIFNHGWVFLIVGTIANGFLLKYRSRKYIAQDPGLKDGYDKYFEGWMIYCNIPWVIMMIGNLCGMTQSTFEYFNPRAMNPMVLVFHFSILILWILSIRWIYFKDGAEFIEKHPGLIQVSGFGGSKYATANQVKFLFPIMLLGGIAGMVMMWGINFPSKY